MKKIKNWIKSLFDKGFEAMKRNSYVAVMVTQRMKVVIDSPIVDIITALTEGPWDDEMKYRLRKLMPEVAAKVAIAHNIIHAEEDASNALFRIKEYIESLGVVARRDWWVLFSANIMEALSDGEISYSELVALTQMAFNELYKKKA